MQCMDIHLCMSNVALCISCLLLSCMQEKIIVKPNARKRKPTIDLQSLDLESIFNGSDQRNQESVLQQQEQADQISISKKKLQVCMMDAPPACGILQSEELASLWRDISRLQRNSKRKRQEIAQGRYTVSGHAAMI